MRPTQRSQVRALFLLIFAASGFSGLIYESIWTHYLKLFLGHAAYAQSLVLAIFMGGMAVGSWLCSRYSFGWKNLLRAYAITEGVIGGSAVVFHPVFNGFLDLAYGTILPTMSSPAVVTAFKWSAGASLILPQSILLGMTFPLMSAGLIRRFPGRPGGTIAMLYFSNSIGGALGVLASGFWLIRLVGLPGTILVAGVMNVCLAALTWRLAGTTAEQPEPLTENALSTVRWTGEARLLVGASLLTGLASFVYEIGWIRMLSLVLGSSTHAFEVMLSAFILGLAFGGLWIRRRIDAIGSPLKFLGYMQVAMGLLAVSTLFIYDYTFDAMQWLVEVLPKTAAGYSWFNLGSHGIALVVMLPTTFCAGTTLPIITVALLRRGHGEASIGAVYGANTLGAIAGVFLAIHLGMPFLGLRGLLVCGAVVDLALGIALLAWAFGPAEWRVPALITAGCVGTVVAALLWAQWDPYKMASGVYRKGTLLSAQTYIVAHKDGKTATVHLTREQEDTLVIRTNGKADAAVNMAPPGKRSSDEATMVLLGALGPLLQPHAKRVANIGFGSGISTHVLLTVPGIEQVDTVEIEPAMVDVARGFWPRNALAYTDPRSKIYFEDAKTFFSTHNSRYDVIVSEPSNPWVSGVAGLFSDEFYGMVKRHLNHDGLLVQWLQLYEIDLPLVASVLKALGGSFDHYVIFLAGPGDMVIVARNGSTIPEVGGAPFRSPDFARELARIGVLGLQDVEIRRIASKTLLDPFLKTIPIQANSDYYPILDQNAARARFLRQNVLDLKDLAMEPFPVFDVMGIRSPSWEHTAITGVGQDAATQRAYAATVFRDAVARGGARKSDGDDGALNVNVGQRISRIIGKCAARPHGGDKVQGMFNVALEIVPYLRPGELESVWHWLEGQPCGSHLSALEADWLKLFKAVGRRESRHMAELAETLIERDPLVTFERLKYLVTTAMLGRLAQGDTLAARNILSRYGGRLQFPKEQSGLLFRLLAAQSTGP